MALWTGPIQAIWRRLGLCILAGGLLLTLPLAARSQAPVFVDVTAAAGITHVHHDLWNPPSQDLVAYQTGGAAVGDVDGDGWDDLFITRFDAPDILYRNQGDGTFEDVTVASGLGSSLPTNGAAFADIDNDGDLDLYVTTAMGRFMRCFKWKRLSRGVRPSTPGSSTKATASPSAITTAMAGSIST